MKYNIPVDNFPRLRAEIDRLNRRAEKLDCPLIDLKILRTFAVKHKDSLLDFEYDCEYHECEVTGESPQLKGWTLVAILQPVRETNENLIREVPGETCPLQFRETDLHCDHCGEIRKRSSIFVLRHDQHGYKQVGRNCLKDFLGHENPENLLKKAEFSISIGQLCNEAECTENWGGLGKMPRVVPVIHFVSVAAILIRKLGWVPRSKADRINPATSDMAWDICTRPNDPGLASWIKSEGIIADPKDIEQAHAAVVWAGKIETKQANSTYLYDLGVCCRQHYADHRAVGFLGSLIPAYQRYLGSMISQKVVKVSQHIGDVKKRQIFKSVTITSTRSFDDQIHPKTLVKFLDTEGNILIWWAAGHPEWLQTGKTVDIKATVVEHGSWQGMAQTVINRATPLEMAVTS